MCSSFAFVFVVRDFTVQSQLISDNKCQNAKDLHIRGHMSWATQGFVPLRQEFCIDLVAPFALAAACSTRSLSRHPVRRFRTVLGGRVLVRRLRLVNLHVAVVLVRGVERLENVLLVKVGSLGVTAMERAIYQMRSQQRCFVQKPLNLSSDSLTPHAVLAPSVRSLWTTSECPSWGPWSSFPPSLNDMEPPNKAPPTPREDRHRHRVQSRKTETRRVFTSQFLLAYFPSLFVGPVAWTLDQCIACCCYFARISNDNQIKIFIFNPAYY